MVRNIEKLIKIEHPQQIKRIQPDTIETFSTIPKLNLTDIEPYTEPGITVHIDLCLDQLEEEEK